MGRPRMTQLLEQAEPQAQGGLAPPRPPEAKIAAVDDPDKPRCADCGHKHTEHIESVRCLGKLSFNGDCTCKKYNPKATS